MRQLKIHNTITRRTDNTERYMNEISKIPLLTMEQEVELAYRVQKGDMRARNELVTHNLRFVISVANQYQSAGISQDDLINEGNLGLIKAAENFDATRGFKFASYAVWWIRQNIMLALANDSRVVRLPGNVQYKLQQYIKMCSHYMVVDGRLPSDEEVMEELGIPKKVLENLKSNIGRQVSLDQNLSEDTESTMLDLLDAGVDAAEAITREHNDARIREIAEKALSMREYNVLALFYGLNGTAPMTLEEIGDHYNLTRERIRQIKERALEKLYENKRVRALLLECF